MSSGVYYGMLTGAAALSFVSFCLSFFRRASFHGPGAGANVSPELRNPRVSGRPQQHKSPLASSWVQESASGCQPVFVAQDNKWLES